MKHLNSNGETSARFHFTKAKLDAVSVPDGKDRIYVYDTAAPLALCRTAKGKASFYVYRRVNGRPKRVRLGAYPAMSISRARQAAGATVIKMHQGIDPVQERRQRRGRLTFADVFKHYLENHAKPHKRTWKEDEGKYQRDLTPLHHRPIDEITRDEIKTLHTRIGSRAPGGANRTLALVSKIFSHARDYFDFEGGNPCIGVKRYPENSRERFLQADELPHFFAALDRHPSPMMADFFRLLLFTGARCGNLQRMEWEHVNLDRGTWTIPGEQFKNGHGQTVYLSAQAVEVLKRRQRGAEAGGYVFTSTKRDGYIKHPGNAWQKVRADADLPDLRMHDLRRTLGSWQAAQGSSLVVIGKTLGHQSQRATAIYSRLNLDPVRDSVDAATAAILAATKEHDANREAAVSRDTPHG